MISYINQIIIEAREKEFKNSLNDKIYTLERDAIELPHASDVFETTIQALAAIRDKMTKNEDSEELSEFCFDMCRRLKDEIWRNNGGWPEDMVIPVLNEAMKKIAKALFKARKTMPQPRTEEERPITKLDADQSGEYDELGQASINTRTSFTVVEQMCHVAWSEARAVIEGVYDALCDPGLSPWMRKNGLKLLYRICGRHALLPVALEVDVPYDRSSIPPYRGGFADVWRGSLNLHGDVAVKVIRIYSNSALENVIQRFCKEVMTWHFLHHPNILQLTGVMFSENEFAMVSDWMDNGDINQFLRKHPGVDRFALLAGAMEGLIYLHGNEMIHGDLKGANILVDGLGCARLADFGLLTMIVDSLDLFPPSTAGPAGTLRWMSPELLFSPRYGPGKSYPTIPSDCYALGMVIYEVIRGELPFREDTDAIVIMKMMKGEHPARSGEFPDNLWRMLEFCWARQPNDRPRIEDVLRCLRMG